MHTTVPYKGKEREKRQKKNCKPIYMFSVCHKHSKRQRKSVIATSLTERRTTQLRAIFLMTFLSLVVVVSQSIYSYPFINMNWTSNYPQKEAITKKKKGNGKSLLSQLWLCSHT